MSAGSAALGKLSTAIPVRNEQEEKKNVALARAEFLLSQRVHVARYTGD